MTSGLKIKSPLGDLTRPTTSIVREALINIFREKIKGSSWLDLFSGSGLIGCEALQYGARRVLAIEIHKNTANLCKSNLEYIRKRSEPNSEFQVICSDVITCLSKGQNQKKVTLARAESEKPPGFDFIYLDPPYHKKIYTETINILSRGDWVKRSTILICECSQSYIPEIPKEWKLTQKKKYGKTCLLFLTPSLALHYYGDIGSKHSQTNPIL